MFCGNNCNNNILWILVIIILIYGGGLNCRLLLTLLPDEETAE